MAIIETGSGATGSATVDSNNNLKVTTPQVLQRLGGDTAAPNNVGAIKMYSENDAGSVTGEPYLKSPFVSEDFRMNVGMDTNLAQFNFTPTTQNTGDFKHAFTTMTMTQTAGFLNINPALATVSGNYAYLQSWQHFPLMGSAALHVEIVGQVTAVPVANQIFETGLFLGTAGTVPADGVFFRMTSAGITGVITYSGVETTTGVMVTSPAINTNAKYKIIISQREVSFWIDDVLYEEILVPNANAIPYLTLSLPLCFMMRNTGTVTGGITVKIGTAHIDQTDMQTAKTFGDQMSIQGNAYQGQEGDTMGSLAVYSNAAVAAAAAITNTTAAAGNTGLGGVVQVLPTLAAGTDGILFSYLNPVGSTTQPPKTLVIKGIHLDSGVQTALTGGPLVYVMGIAYGHTAVSLATTESASFATGTTRAPRRIPLGMQCYAATSAVGTSAQAIRVTFENAPVVVYPGQYFAITARNLGTVTTAGAVAFTCNVIGYFE